jgi:crossover junction endodeoxyribonuclease RuvC
VTGYALVEGGEVSGPVCRLAGEIRPRPGNPLAQRLADVFEGLDKIIAEHQPEEMAVEDVFFAKNARSALALGHVRGVVLLAAARHGLPVATYSANAIKKSVVGYGRAGKEQVGQMVCSLLSIKADLGPDVTDALACALCHLNSSATAKRVQAALDKTR